MLVPGNSKLGLAIWTFSLPAVTTCPGASRLCQTLCYARKGRFVFADVQRAYQRNLELSRRPDFAAKAIRRIRNQGILWLRLHTSGDFYDPTYTARWKQVVRACPRTTFFAYTRSWQVPAILEELILLAAEPNVFLWFSCDRQTGQPPLVPRVRRAWMAADDADVPAFPVDLVFRNRRASPLKRLCGVLVCPTNQKVRRKEKITCSTCRLCFEDDHAGVLVRPLENLSYGDPKDFTQQDVPKACQG